MSLPLPSGIGSTPIHDGNGDGKMGIMELSDDVHTTAAMATKIIEFFHCHCHRSVN